MTRQTPQTTPQPKPIAGMSRAEIAGEIGTLEAELAQDLATYNHWLTIYNQPANDAGNVGVMMAVAGIFIAIGAVITGLQGFSHAKDFAVRPEVIVLISGAIISLFGNKTIAVAGTTIMIGAVIVSFGYDAGFVLWPVIVVIIGTIANLFGNKTGDRNKAAEQIKIGQPLISAKKERLAEISQSGLVSEYGKLEAELAQDLVTYNHWLAIYNQSSHKTGAIIVILGLAMMVGALAYQGLSFLSLLEWVILIIGIGIIVALFLGNNAADKNKAADQINLGQPLIAAKQARLAELKAHASVGSDTSIPSSTTLSRSAQFSGSKITDAQFDKGETEKEEASNED
jgi:hypothetical protein